MNSPRPNGCLRITDPQERDKQTANDSHGYFHGLTFSQVS
jgi:hypothetical protein